MRRVKWLDEGVRVRIESEDDLWVLSHICGSGCLVGMLSHRRDSTTGTKEDSRAKSAERKPMWILLEASETAFQPFFGSIPGATPRMLPENAWKAVSASGWPNANTRVCWAWAITVS